LSGAFSFWWRNLATIGKGKQVKLMVSAMVCGGTIVTLVRNLIAFFRAAVVDPSGWPARSIQRVKKVALEIPSRASPT